VRAHVHVQLTKKKTYKGLDGRDMCKAALGAWASCAARAQCKLEPRWLANVPMCGPRWAKALDAVSSLLTRASALESVLEARALTAALLAF